MDILALASMFERLAQAAPPTEQAQKIHYMQIIDINKKAQTLLDIASKAQYTDQIKDYIRNIANMAGALAVKAHNQGVKQADSISSHNQIKSLTEQLKTWIRPNTYKPLDDLLKAVDYYTPVDITAQGGTAPQTGNPANIPASTPVPASSMSAIPTQNTTSV